MSKRNRTRAVQDTELLLLDALNAEIGLIVSVAPQNTKSFIHRCNNLIEQEGYPIVTRIVKSKPDFVWLVKRPQSTGVPPCRAE